MKTFEEIYGSLNKNNKAVFDYYRFLSPQPEVPYKPQNTHRDYGNSFFPKGKPSTLRPSAPRSSTSRTTVSPRQPSTPRPVPKQNNAARHKKKAAANGAVANGAALQHEFITPEKSKLNNYAQIPTNGGGNSPQKFKAGTGGLIAVIENYLEYVRKHEPKFALKYAPEPPISLLFETPTQREKRKADKNAADKRKEANKIAANIREANQGEANKNLRRASGESSSTNAGGRTNDEQKSVRDLLRFFG